MNKTLTSNPLHTLLKQTKEVYRIGCTILFTSEVGSLPLHQIRDNVISAHLDKDRYNRYATSLKYNEIIDALIKYFIDEELLVCMGERYYITPRGIYFRDYARSLNKVERYLSTITMFMTPIPEDELVLYANQLSRPGIRAFRDEFKYLLSMDMIGKTTRESDSITCYGITLRGNHAIEYHTSK